MAKEYGDGEDGVVIAGLDREVLKSINISPSLHAFELKALKDINQVLS